MRQVIGDNFCKDNKYKLYRSVYEIIHPTISKKNISNYKVVVDDKLFPVVVYYPKRVSDIKSAIIFVPGDGNVSGCYGKYNDICKNLALETDKLVIAIDYFESSIKYPTTVNKCCKVINYLVNELDKNGVSREKITLMGDSTGANILGSAIGKMADKKICFSKMILLCPIVRYDYSNYDFDESYINLNFNLDKKIVNYFKKYLSSKKEAIDLLNREDYSLFPKILVIGGDTDIIKNDGVELIEKIGSDVDGCKVHNIKYASHGFLNSNDEIILGEVYKEINDFVL